MIENKTLKASAAAVALIRAMIKADKSNVYRNNADVTFTLKLVTPEYADDLWLFVPDRERGITTVMLRSYGGPEDEGGKMFCDGATGASDKPRGVLPATGLHDPGYFQTGAISDAWKDEAFAPGPNYKRDFLTRIAVRKKHPTWTAADVRQLFDVIFGAAIRHGRGHWLVTRTYYSGVRWFGGVWRAAKKIFPAVVAAVVAASMLLGCNGCMSPPDVVEFDNLPEMERVHCATPERNAE